jgi:hypothetical protein
MRLVDRSTGGALQKGKLKGKDERKGRLSVDLAISSNEEDVHKEKLPVNFPSSV